MKSEQLINLIVKSGLRTFKYKNSKHSTLTHVEDDNKKGVVFGFRSKTLMQEGIGFVVGSKEALMDNQEQLTHWTPNIFSWGGYAGADKKHVHGHFENNLIQINTFVLDIDCEEESKMRIDYLLVKCLENTDLIPTAIVETPKGYHVYFVLDSASYVSSANSYKSLRTAKAISRNLRLSFAELLPGVDVTCNHFGIFRIPTERNLVHFDANATYDFEDLMNWSLDYSKNIKNNKIVLNTKAKDRTFKQVDANWFKKLLNTVDIIGGKGQVGRNTAIFTASLACYSSDKSQEECEMMMDEFNSNLEKPLNHREVIKAIKSAYSGKYQGAHRDFIDPLSYFTDSTRLKKAHSDNNNRQYWHKFAKSREERKKTHYYEWQRDLIDYINQNTSAYKPYFEVKRDKIMSDLGIPLSTLKDLLKLLKEKGTIYIQTKAGRGGYTRLATKKSMALTLKSKREVLFMHYKDVLARYFPTSRMFTNTVKNIRFDGTRSSKGIDIFMNTT